MVSILLITSRNIDHDGGEKALIIGRHKALYEVFGIKTSIIFFHKDTNDKTESGCEGICFLKSSRAGVRKVVELKLSSGNYSMVVLSGTYDRQLVQYLKAVKKNTGIKIIIDIHATIREMYEYCIPDFYHQVGTRYLFIKKKHRFVNALNIANYAFVVSDELIEETNSFMGKNTIQFLKVRCGCNTTIDSDTFLANRTVIRNKMGYSDDNIAFVYSGSKDRWQKFDETLNLFQRLAKQDKRYRFAFYMNIDEESKLMIRNKLGAEKVTIRWVPANIMQEELVGYDLGVMLRDNKWTNRVAFPNKFSDYIHAGLGMLLSPVNCEPRRLAEQYKLSLFSVEELLNSNAYSQLISKRHDMGAYISLCNSIISKELLYSMQVQQNCFLLLK